jgi:hypothetical protein
VFVCLLVLALAVISGARKTIQYGRSQEQLLAHLQAAPAGAEERMGADQRPWVGLIRPTVYPLGKQGGGFAVKLQNFGKTPAVSIFITDSVRLENLVDLSGMPEAADSHPVAVGTLMPYDRFDTDVWFKSSPEGLASLAQGKVRAVNYALIVYEDMFHRRHTTQSCFYWRAGLSAPLPCERFNSAE